MIFSHPVALLAGAVSIGTSFVAAASDATADSVEEVPGRPEPLVAGVPKVGKDNDALPNTFGVLFVLSANGDLNPLGTAKTIGLADDPGSLPNVEVAGAGVVEGLSKGDEAGGRLKGDGAAAPNADGKARPLDIVVVAPAAVPPKPKLPKLAVGDAGFTEPNALEVGPNPNMLDIDG